MLTLLDRTSEFHIFTMFEIVTNSISYPICGHIHGLCIKFCTATILFHILQKYYFNEKRIFFSRSVTKWHTGL